MGRLGRHTETLPFRYQKKTFMPIDVTQCAETGLITVRLRGEIEAPLVLEALDELDALLETGACVPAFWDAREITLLAVAPSEIGALLYHMLKLGRRVGPGRTAIMTRREIDGLMARILQLQLPGSPRVWKRFNREDEAMAWVLADEPAAHNV